MSDGMIVVTEVKIERCPRRDAVIATLPKSDAYRGPNDMVSPCTWKQEDVRGETYVTPTGLVCIGLSQQAREAIGIPLGVMQQQRDRIEELEKRQAYLETEWSKERRRVHEITDRLGRVTLWERVRILFGADVRRIVG